MCYSPTNVYIGMVSTILIWNCESHCLDLISNWQKLFTHMDYRQKFYIVAQDAVFAYYGCGRCLWGEGAGKHGALKVVFQYCFEVT